MNNLVGKKQKHVQKIEVLLYYIPIYKSRDASVDHWPVRWHYTIARERIILLSLAIRRTDGLAAAATSAQSKSYLLCLQRTTSPPDRCSAIEYYTVVVNCQRRRWRQTAARTSKDEEIYGDGRGAITRTGQLI